MKLLVIGIDRSVADPSSAAAARQREYFVGWDVNIVILAAGEAKRIELVPRLIVHVTGGSNRALALWRGLRLVRRLAREQRPDVVTAQDPFWSGLIARAASQKGHCGLHLQDHSGFFARRPFTAAEKFLLPVAKFLARRADRIRTVSQRGKRGLESIGIAPDKIDVIPISTDVLRFSSIQRQPVKAVLCIARLEKEKGVEVLLQAFGELQKRHPDYSLTILGDGSQRAALEHIAPQGVHFVGQGADIRPYLERAAIYVQPSHFEGWGMAVVEAAAAGVPIVMTDVGLAGEVIRDGESGFVIPPGDVDGLVEALEKLIVDHALAERIASNAKKSVHALPSPERTIELVRQSLQNAQRKPRLLIVTQAVDQSDPLLGFFHDWIAAMAKQVDGLTVICLKRGRIDLPSNVRVFSLGKEESVGRVSYLRRFFSLIWHERRSYDAVFVHMNEIYVVLAGWLWRLLGKRIGLWRNHPKGTAMTPLAVLLANRVYCTSPYSFTARYRKTIRMPAGIDTDVFKPQPGVTRDPSSILFFGRLSPVKRPEVLIDGLAQLTQNLPDGWSARMVGDAADPSYLAVLKDRLKDAKLEERVHFESSITNREAPRLYSTSGIYVNATPTGSFDKTVIEAMACGCLVAVGNRNFSDAADIEIFREGDPSDLARVLQLLLDLSPAERERRRVALREYAIKTHGLDVLITRLLASLN